MPATSNIWCLKRKAPLAYRSLTGGDGARCQGGPAGVAQSASVFCVRLSSLWLVWHGRYERRCSDVVANASRHHSPKPKEYVDSHVSRRMSDVLVCLSRRANPSGRPRSSLATCIAQFSRMRRCDPTYVCCLIERVCRWRARCKCKLHHRVVGEQFAQPLLL